jgi:hypothetical protein
MVQCMAPSGVDVRVAAHQQPSYGAVISLGLGGSVAMANPRRSVRVIPLTDADARRLILSSPIVPLLADRDGEVDQTELAALEDLLLQLAWAVEQMPELADVELNPPCWPPARRCRSPRPGCGWRRRRGRPTPRSDVSIDAQRPVDGVDPHHLFGVSMAGVLVGLGPAVGVVLLGQPAVGQGDVVGGGVGGQPSSPSGRAASTGRPPLRVRRRDRRRRSRARSTSARPRWASARHRRGSPPVAPASGAGDRPRPRCARRRRACRPGDGRARRLGGPQVDDDLVARLRSRCRPRPGRVLDRFRLNTWNANVRLLDWPARSSPIVGVNVARFRLNTLLNAQREIRGGPQLAARWASPGTVAHRAPVASRRSDRDLEHLGGRTLAAIRGVVATRQSAIRARAARPSFSPAFSVARSAEGPSCQPARPGPGVRTQTGSGSGQAGRGRRR